MVRLTSPLRYPGGKSSLFDLISLILRENRLERGHYIEPYAGGCGLALSLLFEGCVSDIHINDLDTSIWAFWHCVLNKTEEFISLIENASVTIEEWRRQREIHSASNISDTLQLAFATFFLNRTNRSGIIKGAGAIGGQKQDGNYKLDCRFNRMDLIRRIRRIAKYRNRIYLTNLDAILFMQKTEEDLPEKSLYCIDPPYFNNGRSLYTSFYGPNDHQEVAKSALILNRPWIVTYDYTEEIKILYETSRQFLFNINYSLQTKRVGTELLVASKGLRLPNEMKERQINYPQYRAA